MQQLHQSKYIWEIFQGGDKLKFGIEHPDEYQKMSEFEAIAEISGNSSEKEIKIRKLLKLF